MGETRRRVTRVRRGTENAQKAEEGVATSLLRGKYESKLATLKDPQNFRQKEDIQNRDRSTRGHSTWN